MDCNWTGKSLVLTPNGEYVSFRLKLTMNFLLLQDNVPLIVLKGCMRATFSPASNKLVCAEILFDSSSVASQTKCLMPFQDSHNAFASGAESDPCALLDSVLSQAPTVASTKQENSLCSVSVVSADKGDSSDDDCHTQQIKKE